MSYGKKRNEWIFSQNLAHSSESRAGRRSLPNINHDWEGVAIGPQYQPSHPGHTRHVREWRHSVQYRPRGERHGHEDMKLVATQKQLRERELLNVSPSGLPIRSSWAVRDWDTFSRPLSLRAKAPAV